MPFSQKLTLQLYLVKQAKREEAERDRIIKEHHLAELEKQRKAIEEAEARKKADAQAVEKWKIEQAEKAAKEKREKEEAEIRTRHELRQRLMASGMPEHQIQAILNGPRTVPPPPPPMIPMGPYPHPQHMRHPHGPLPPPPPPPPPPLEVVKTKSTYTRMARKHLSIEALRERAIEFELDKACIFWGASSSRLT